MKRNENIKEHTYFSSYDIDYLKGNISLIDFKTHVMNKEGVQKGLGLYLIAAKEFYLNGVKNLSLIDEIYKTNDFSNYDTMFLPFIIELDKNMRKEK